MISSDAAGHFSTPPPLLRHGASSALHVIIGCGPAFGACRSLRDDGLCETSQRYPVIKTVFDFSNASQVPVHKVYPSLPCSVGGRNGDRFSKNPFSFFEMANTVHDV
jgi:hypothetical protein